MLIILFQTGCWDQKLFEEIGFVLQMGLELNDKGDLVYSATLPVVTEKAEGKTEFFQTTSENLIRASKEKIRNTSGKKIQGGKVQFLYFSKELANKGIYEFFDIYFRDPEKPLLANVIVVEGSPKEMLELSNKLENKALPELYIANLIVDARLRNIIPETRIFDFAIQYCSKTIDPATPLFKFNEKGIEISGTALFNKDKMVGQIDDKQSMILNALKGNKGEFEYIYKGDELQKERDMIKKGAAITLLISKPDIKIDVTGEVPVINIKQSFNGILDESSLSNTLDKPEVQKQFEEVIGEALKKDMTALIEYLQEVESDPIGFGEIVRAKHNEYWKKVNWKEKFKQAEIKLDIKVNLRSYGTLN